MASFINVRIGKLPGKIQEVALNGDRTVATALATAHLDPTGFEVRVQGRPADPTTQLHEGDIVLLVRKIKGNSLPGVVMVQVGRVPGPGLETVALEEGKVTVAAALEAAGIYLAPGEVVYVGDEPATSATPVADGATIVVRRGHPAAPEESEEEFSSGEEPEFEFDLDLEAEAEGIAARAQRVAAALKTYRSAKAELEDAVEEFNS